MSQCMVADKMNTKHEEVCVEQKMDQISEISEGLVLDAMIEAVQKIKQRNLIFNSMAQNSHPDDVPF